MREPSVEALPDELRRAAREIARGLREHGHQGWIVGGAVRDLALERAIGELDMATAATPSELEAIFARTHAVGRAFGTVIVICAGDIPIEVTTFRSERGYSDARRPDRVHFGASVEEDAKRRDFTCNALYLAPEPAASGAPQGALVDPTGGLADIEARLLRAVGDPRARFAEDGLRLLRLARFRATLGFAIEPATGDAARASRASLDGVSAERLAAELEAVFEGGVGALALETLLELGLLEVLFPTLARASLAERCARVGTVDGLRDPALATAAFLDPSAPASTAEAGHSRPEEWEAVLRGLKPSRARLADVRAILGVADQLERLARDDRGQRAALIELRRSPAFERGVALARGRCSSPTDEPGQRTRERIERVVERARALQGADVAEAPWIESADLAAAGLPPGPAWRALLSEALALQLDRSHASRDEALRWLAARVDALDAAAGDGGRQDGGK